MTVANFKSIGGKAKSLLVKVCKAIPGPECGTVASKLIKVYRDKKNWDSARSFCRATNVFGVDGDLVVDDDSETHRFLTKQVP